ncbi:DUF294 nucleotidyltransferase-like domain-containing protein [Mesobacillus maritimus]|uniref:DUF294 nucleotidyltransferase-like domain-containing protein n=1 Tax=Mesobacillus maritimus TaxID=1643336 RepID=UPI00203FEC89|nr:DUF294 nucleotidyltransferase-like domain-containing protein [Mesobacillus maritimus]MCM3585633.1 DUF294 nucleotidyltransferase-like domain-containing protein [Mesobacillus maritimus]MCM3669105.1 DUF294 nucleotidyltransferase-like domain-containing protein [Mesobacillus maritimus]
MAIYKSYTQIRSFRDQKISQAWSHSALLNDFHDELMKQTIALAIRTVEDRLGPPRSPYCFFLMGSAGRLEQGIWSDQDHGIIYDSTEPEAQEYFLALGKEFVEGLAEVGYKVCDGNVMASNPLWCKSTEGWNKQVSNWLLDSSWESIRHFLTFFDARCFYGKDYLTSLKNSFFPLLHRSCMLTRIIENTMHIKKGVGVLGQFLLETHGPFTGCINLKDTAFFPYVNAARVLAIRNNSVKTSTVERLQQLTDIDNRERFITQFIKLQDYRLSYGLHSDYEAGHYVKINQMSKQQQKDLKIIIKDGIQLLNHVKEIVAKDDSSWA